MPSASRRVSVVTFGLLAASFGYPAEQISVVRATTLRTEYLVNPLALNTTMPGFDWSMEAANTRGAQQTAYQILVASSAANLVANTGDLWDTGKLESNATNQVTTTAGSSQAGTRHSGKSV